MNEPSVSLEGKVAVVTGGSRGIGLATAQVLAEHGARVVVLARDAKRLASAAESIGERAVGIACDVSAPDSVRSAFARIDGELGRVDVLINNAAIGRLHRVEEATDDDVAAGIGTNFAGVVYCTREAIPRMRRAGGGHVVFVSSEAVRMPFPYLSLYVATKGAVETFSRAMRQELREHAIRVTLFRSGASSAGFMEEWDPDKAAEAMRAWEEGGYLRWVGTPMSPRTIADSIVHALTRPVGASADEIELRSA